MKNRCRGIERLVCRSVKNELIISLLSFGDIDQSEDIIAMPSHVYFKSYYTLQLNKAA